MGICTAQRPFCFHWLTSQPGHQWNCLKQESIVLIAIPYSVVHHMDPTLEEVIFGLTTTPHPTQIPTQTLDTPTVHHLATVMAAPSPNHSWQEVSIFNPMKLKCFMKVRSEVAMTFKTPVYTYLPTIEADFSVWVACGLRPQTEIKLGQISLGSSTKLCYYIYRYHHF